MKNLLLYVALMILVVPSYSQISKGGQPFMYDSLLIHGVDEQIRRSPKVNNIVVVTDLDKATEEMRIEQLTGKCNSCRDGGKYYGREMDIEVDFFSRALMTPVDDGELWTLKIVSEKSEGFQFIFSDFYLPDGCLLFFYNGEKNMHLGAFTSVNNREDGRFITQNLNGSIAYIELFVPAKIKEQPLLFLDKIVYIFDNSLKIGPFNPNEPLGDCFINIACNLGWQEEAKSVAIILQEDGESGYYGTCTGALINKNGNYVNSDQPYFLTANHCYQSFNPTSFSNLNDWVFLFGHESRYCLSNGGDVSNSTTKSATGAEYVAKDDNSATSDYLLLKLNNTVDEIIAYDISFAGWDRSEDPYRTGVVGIHHPSGDIKKISISNNPVISDQFVSRTFTSAPNHHWRVVWSEGVTAPGSSGSPLFNNNKQIIGFLTGGSSSCDTLDNPDYYGKMSKAFNSGNFQNHLGHVFSVNNYSPAIIIDYNLPLTIQTEPKNVFIGKSTKVKVEAKGGSAPIKWWIWINKKPNDFGDYQYGDNVNCVNWTGTSNTINFETGNHTFNQVGTYKATVFAIDDVGRQSPNIVFSIVVTESQNECISAYIYQTNSTSNQLVFPKGAVLNISQQCDVKLGTSSNSQDNCYTDTPKGWGTFYSKYHGIARLEWEFNDRNVGTETFNDASGAFDLLRWTSESEKPRPPRHYYYSTKSFSLTEAGTHTIKLKAWGGSFDKSPDRTFYKYPFRQNGEPSTATMTIQVVDCDANILFNQSYYNSRYSSFFSKPHQKVDLKSGHIAVQNVTINATDAPVNFTAYNSITLKSGTHIKSGAVFLAKIEGCPEYNAVKNTNDRGFSEDYRDVFEPISRVSLYPNPTRDIVNIDMIETFPEVLYYEIYDMSGRLLIRNIPQDQIEKYQFTGQPNGAYLVRIVYNNFTEEVKDVILNR